MREYKLLISHVAKDKDIALKCVEALEKNAVVGEGDNCFTIVPIYMESKTNGCFGDFIEWSENAVIGSDGVLAIITDNTVETITSADGNKENVKVVYNELSLAREKLKDILVLSKQGISLQSGYALLLQNIKREDYVGDGLDNAIAGIVADVILHAKRRFGGHPLLEYAGKVGARLIPSAIADTSDYLGRADKLAEIDECFNNGKRVVCITGFGGIGKTTLAKMYAKAHPEDPVVIQYCSAEETNLKNAIVSLGMEFDSPEFGSMTIDEKYALRIHQLGDLDKRTLIIIDNFNADFGSVSNREVLTELSAIDKCKFIISSRNTLSRKDIGVVKVGKLNDDELIELFYRDSHCERNEDNDNYIKKLIVQTNGHTMTMELAAKAVGIDENGVSLPEIVDGLLSVDAVTNVEDRHDGYEDYNTIYEHLRQLFNLSRITDSEKHLLGALSFVARRGLTISELKSNVEYDTKDLIRLCALGYIVKSGESVITYSLHPLMSELAFTDFVNDVEQFKEIIEFLVFEKSRPTRSDTLADLDMRLDYAENLYGRLAEFRRSNYFCDRHLMICCQNQGDIMQAKGDIATAEQYYRQGYEIIDEITDGVWTPEKWQDLSLSCGRLGDILFAKGDIVAAEQYYKLGYEYAYKYARDYYEGSWMVESQRDLSISCMKLGDVLRAKGDVIEAEKYYKQGYEFAEKIAKETWTIESRRDVSISCERLGDILRVRGDIDGAEQYYRHSYELTRAIYDETITIETRRDLSICCGRLGVILWDKGNINEAEWHYRQDYELAKVNAEEARTIKARRDFSVSSIRLGDVLRAKGNFDEAERYYIHSYEITDLISKEIWTIETRRDLSICCERLADVLRMRGDIDGAEQYCRHCYELTRAISEEVWTIETRRDLARSCDMIGEILKAKGNIAEAKQYYMQSYELSKAVAEEAGTIEALDDLIICNFNMGNVVDTPEIAMQYLLVAFEMAEDLHNRHVDFNGRYKMLAESLSNIYKEMGDIEGYERMQNILKSLS